MSKSWICARCGSTNRTRALPCLKCGRKLKPRALRLRLTLGRWLLLLTRARLGPMFETRRTRATNELLEALVRLERRHPGKLEALYPKEDQCAQA